MNNHAGKRLAAGIALAVTILAVAHSCLAEELSHGWRRSGLGFWGEKPEVQEGTSDNGIAVELTIPPGDCVSYEKRGSWSSDNASIRMYTDNVIPYGNDYFPGKADFPVSVTFVYGGDSLKLGNWSRFLLFFKELRNGFRPSGIRLTYAWGSTIPVGSMYHLWEEETVFILAGKEEAGKEVSTARRLSKDFSASYGRAPAGPVTKLLVEACRPSTAKGAAKTSVTLRYPVE